MRLSRRSPSTAHGHSEYGSCWAPGLALLVGFTALLAADHNLITTVASTKLRAQLQMAVAVSHRPRSPRSGLPDFVKLTMGSLVVRTPHEAPSSYAENIESGRLQPESELAYHRIQGSKPHCFCIKMTRGSFVDYTRSCLLHCGIPIRRARCTTLISMDTI